MRTVLRQNRRNLLVVFITLLIVFETATYVATTPRPSESFFQLYVLGENHMASDYYPEGRPEIYIGDSVKWYVGVTNNMGSVQLIALRVKLGNQTINPPSDLQGLPSPAAVVSEFDRFLLNNETWEIPFVWRISNLTYTSNATRLLELQINNVTYELPEISAYKGVNFRFMIELWSWDIQSDAMQFGWFAGTEHRVAWVQVWFSSPSP